MTRNLADSVFSHPNLAALSKEQTMVPSYTPRTWRSKAAMAAGGVALAAVLAGTCYAQSPSDSYEGKGSHTTQLAEGLAIGAVLLAAAAHRRKSSQADSTYEMPRSDEHF